MSMQVVRSSVDESEAGSDAAGQVCELQESVLGSAGWQDHPRETVPNFARPGYIYVVGTYVKEEYFNLAKIGKANDPWQRLAQIDQDYRREPKLPFRLAAPKDRNLLIFECWLDHMNRLESYLHRRFAAQRLEGEWFTLEAPRDFNAIRDLVTPWPMILSQCHCHRCAYDTSPFLLREYPPPAA